ncbi:protein SUPPRESSOR OF MAX2 1-like, partial [Rutidosis leptorrhynchoides]|uniref:protein SUPPRESSOR OF MAX2 1-like n=1 Tax=Rutidosis leptorrhynchoides TaxID=125765 RepID=UPI003A998717
MRAGLSTIQQTLTSEAATVLNQSIAEAGRRNHGQTTPLHVAATLLSSPSGYLRQACIKSHPNSSHPLQCRALELCFRVALERLPTAQNIGPGSEPPISNALMAALKRAQAHQRRGCPEQQQQPLLAVKVELEQLIISILDDPSVSRVMREASFSSPAVKATIEQSIIINSSSTNSGSVPKSNPIGLGGFRSSPITVTPNRNLYLNPRLQQNNNNNNSNVNSGGEEVKRVVDILSRSKKKNPILVGESEPESVIKELLRRIECKEFSNGVLKIAQVIYFEFGTDKDQLGAKIKELGSLIESKIGNSDDSGVILNMGDLKWLVEQPPAMGLGGGGTTEAGKTAVVEMGNLLGRFSGRLWLIGSATCETYLRCQVYHPSMENDWDLQALPIATRAPPSSLFPRLGTNGILSRSVESLSPLKAFSPATAAAPPRQLSENLDPIRRTSCCPQCTRNYEQELAELTEESEKSKVKSESSRPSLPQWLQNAKTQDQKPTEDQEVILKQKTKELEKKWNDTCLNLHPNFHYQPSIIGNERIVPTPISLTGLYNNHNLMSCQNFQPKLLQLQHKPLGESLQLNPNLSQARKPSGSPVRTELVLGPTAQEKVHQERVKDFLGCIPSEPPPSRVQQQELQSDRIIQKSPVDADSFKRLLKGLMEKVWWQQDAASAVAATVTQCKLGNGKCHRSKGDMWLLFTGPDNVGKKKMAFALSELVCGTSPVMVSLGSRRSDDAEPNAGSRGKTALDRIVEAVRKNPFSVIVLSDIDEADMLVRGSIKRAMERGRLTDSHGREISLGNIIFILTANWLPESLKFLSSNGVSFDEKKIISSASGNWQLKLSICPKTSKRRQRHWLNGDDD